MSQVRKLAQATRRRLGGTPIGRWLLLPRYPMYGDHFARMMLAVDAYQKAEEARPLRFRLHRCAHRIEKGLSMPARRHGFGESVMRELAMLLGRAHRLLGAEHPSYLWASGVAQAYFTTLDRDIESADPGERDTLVGLRDRLQSSFENVELPEAMNGFQTPLGAPATLPSGTLESFERLMGARQSVRRFLADPVPIEAVRLAMTHALRAPSACNRQPFGVVAIEDRARIGEAAALLPGGGGFAADAPLLCALTSDFGAYSGHEQRNLAYIDGGLAAMPFMLSLTAQGYGSVAMNWSVSVERDRAMRHLLGIRETQIFLFFVAVGRPHPDALVPASARRSPDETLVWIAPENGGRQA